MNGLEGQVVIVTGASSGLGEQLARALVSAGARPVLAARRAERLHAIRDELGEVDTVTCDITSEEDRERLVETTFERHGHVDGLVNNAGIDAFGPASRTEPDAFRRVLDSST